MNKIHTMNRRQFIQAVAVASCALGAPYVRADVRSGPKTVIDETRVISWEPDKYHGWPTIARRANGELLLAYSGGRVGHTCPLGRLEMMRSRNGGRTWSWPQVIYDSPIDDRDGGIMETAKGSLLITTFTFPGRIEDPPVDQRQAVLDRATEDQRRSELGCYMLRSTDGGITWSARQRVPLNSPHGPTQLRDGRILFPGIARWTTEQKMGVCESRDDGVTWQWLADIPDRPGDRRFQSPLKFNYLELTALECADGKIICQLRNRNNPNDGETLQTESVDGGQSWNPPHPIGVWGTPSHLLRLRDGRALMTYGHRRKPFGNQARVSTDDGATWSEPVIVSGDGAGGDLGYPSTVQLEDGTLVTVWYEQLAGNPRAQLRQARWRLA